MNGTMLRASARRWSTAVGVLASVVLTGFAQGGVAGVEKPLVLSPATALSEPSMTEPQDLLWPHGVSSGVELLEPQPQQTGQLEQMSLAAAPVLPPPSSKSQGQTESSDAATAIPLPPAVESGLSGILALALAGCFRPLRRLLRS